MKVSADPVMQALAYPFTQDLAALPAGKNLLANPLPGLGPWSPEQTTIWQWWKHAASAFDKDGYKIVSDNLTKASEFSAVFLRLPRQREESQYVMASAWAALKSGGLFITAAANDAGGARLEKDLAPYIQNLQSASKHKCRVVWCQKETQSLPASWLVGGAMQKQPATGLWTQPGLFSWDRMDRATTKLLPLLPNDLKGRVADPGCGTGVIALHVLKNNPGVTVVCMDADARAIETTRKNIGEYYPGAAADYLWADLSQPIKIAPVDTVIMNPPFHAEKTQTIALGQSFIKNAADMLKPGGSLWMVANAHLPYEQILQAHFKTMDKKFEKDGFKIFHAMK